MEIVIYSGYDIIKPPNTETYQDTQSIESFCLSDCICTELSLSEFVAWCDLCVCVIASSDSWAQVTRSQGPSPLSSSR